MHHFHLTGSSCKRFLRALVWLSPVSLLFVACTPTITSESVETNIKSGFQDLTGFVLDSIDCPENIAAQAGKTYECAATATGESFKIAVKPTGEGAQFNWEPVPMAMNVNNIETQLRDYVQGRSKFVVDSVNCPKLILADSTKVYECELVAGQERGVVRVKPTGKDTQYDWELVTEKNAGSTSSPVSPPSLNSPASPAPLPTPPSAN